ncbi:MAG: UvrD-helicase domain-containing protein [Alistipes sp.]|nr:UvrD-helicase domain-containing protein [Alistipes sp.]
MQSEILKGLSEAQRAAVENFEQPSLIIAGAGSGKTRVLTSRIAYMIERGVKPWQILALTFTNKAAAEMRERIERMVGDGSRYIRMGTFHSVFSRILRENAERIGYPTSFTIYEPNDVKSLLKTIIKEMQLSDDKYKPNVIASRISMAKNALITPGAYLAKTIYATEDRQAQIPEFGNIYNEYCRRCKRNGAMDFDDLLLQTNILLKDCPDVLAKYQELFQYILVDEYQDTNYAQYIIIRRLSQLHGRVCVVGDDAQSIYSFRGAKIENILSFRNDYPAAQVFKLEQNYRSTRTIVNAANSIIKKNARQLEKTCFSQGDEGDKIRVLKAYTDREEAELVVGDLRDKIRETGDKWSEAVILYRTNNQSAVLEDNLRRRGIPYRIYKGSSFYDHKEIRDLMGYIRLVINPRDDEAFKRIVNYPARGIGETTVERIAQIAAARQTSMWEAVDQLVEEPVEDAVQRAIVRKVKEFVNLIRTLSLARTTMGLYDFGLEIANKSGILPLYRQDNSPENASALSNIEELLNSMQEFKERVDAEIRNGERDEMEEATIEEWLQGVMLMTDMDSDDPDDQNKVTLMTVHSAKGLEYKYVYIVGLEENLFPSMRAAESAEGIEEERRLFYVALTRAKCAATISYAEMRFKWGNMEFSRPSMFLREIDPAYIESEVDFRAERQRPAPSEEGAQAIDELRRRFDYRFQQKRQEGASAGGYGQRNGQRNGYGNSYRTSDGESGRVQRFTRQNDPYRKQGSTSYPNTRTQFDGQVKNAVETLKGEPRRLVSTATVAPTSAPLTDCAFHAGDRVEHALFGRGEILRIERANGDWKLVVDFPNAGQKTLLTKFAKLRKL